MSSSPKTDQRFHLRRRLLAAGAAACVLPARAQPGRTVTDSAGRRVALRGTARRVYAAGPPASILVFAAAPDTLLGWTTPFRPAERPFVASRYADLPVLGRLTGRGNTANVEVVLGARPEIIIDYGTISPTYTSLADRVQQQTGIPYLLIDGAFDRMEAAITLVGEITGETASAAALARYARETVEDVTRRVARVPTERRPRVYYARGPRGLETGLAGSINVEILERTGAVNVAAELGKAGLAQISFEQVLRWNPEVIVTTDPNFYQVAARSPLWRPLAAVRSRRVYFAPAVPFGWIDFPPSLNRLIGLRWMGKILYPDQFAEDLRPAVREFYARLYHQTPSEPQLDELLRSTEPAAA